MYLGQFRDMPNTSPFRSVSREHPPRAPLARLLLASATTPSWLPPTVTHFGGRPRRTTTDSLHLLTRTIKDSWRKHEVVSVLYLDTAGAFPNAVPETLYRNLRKQRVPEGYIRFVRNMLTGRTTHIRFDDYQSDRFPVNNGFGQGDPLSMISYLFYNADSLILLLIPTNSRWATSTTWL